VYFGNVKHLRRKICEYAYLKAHINIWKENLDMDQDRDGILKNTGRME
jgi:hypothetical protein